MTRRTCEECKKPFYANLALKHCSEHLGLKAVVGGRVKGSKNKPKPAQAPKTQTGA